MLFEQVVSIQDFKGPEFTIYLGVNTNLWIHWVLPFILLPLLQAPPHVCCCVDETGAVAELLECGYAEEVWWEGVAWAGVGGGVETGLDEVGAEEVLVKGQL